MTPQQFEVYEYVNEFHSKYKLSPTYQEIYEECNLSSKNHAHVIVTRLCELGYLAKNKKYEERGIIPVKKDE
tara:strand:- start:1241 stop:1456 length:216 start_codon:yes stop_codon:yes gene_type:complete